MGVRAQGTQGQQQGGEAGDGSRARCQGMTAMLVTVSKPDFY